MIATKTRLDALGPLLERLQRDYFATSELTEPRERVVAARFLRSNLTSVFRPVTRVADGAVAGDHAQLRVFDEAGQAAAPWSLFAKAASDGTLLQLDRLARTLHALNYFAATGGEGPLFLNVERRLLTIVTHDHGAYFRAILRELDVAPGRIAIVLPRSALDDPVSFVRAAISYRIHGYRVAAQLREGSDADLEHIALADPHYLAIDAVPQPAPRQLATLERRGITLVSGVR